MHLEARGWGDLDFLVSRAVRLIVTHNASPIFEVYYICYTPRNQETGELETQRLGIPETVVLETGKPRNQA